MRFLLRPLLILAFFICLGMGVRQCMAHDASHPNADWYKAQKMTPETRDRLRFPMSFTSCCDKGDAVENLRLRVVEDGSRYGAETYEYLTASGWKRVHPDIIQRGRTPTGQPVLFILQSGHESCLIIDREGG